MECLVLFVPESLVFSLLSKYIKIKVYRPLILPRALNGGETLRNNELTNKGYK